MKTKKIFSKELVFLGIFIFLAATFLVGISKTLAKTIEMNGEFDDWDDVDLLISDSIEGYPYSGTVYYFNNATNSWQTNAIAGACMYTANRALDLGELKLTNDDNYLYILWGRGSDFLNYYWRNGDATEESFFSNEVATGDNNNPCAGEIVTAPADFNHELVLSIDKDQNGTFDYYLTINVFFTAGEFQGYDTAGYIYQDNGDGEYLVEEEILLTTFADHEYEVMPNVSALNGLILQEVKMDVAEIFSKLDLDWGEAVDVRYEAHSEGVDNTAVAEYIFSENETNNVDKEINKASVRKFTSINSGKEKIRLAIYGKNFSRSDKVKLGSKKAYKVTKSNDKKLVAYFYMDDVRKLGKKKLSLKIVAENGDEIEFSKKKIKINKLKEWENDKNLIWLNNK